MNTPPILVYVVDDQPIIRDGLQYMIDRQPDMKTAGTAGTVADAMADCRTTSFDVALVDIRLPDGSGLELVRAFRRLRPNAKSLLVTTFDIQEYVLDALRSGALGYVLKDLPTQELMETIRAVHRGEAMYRTRCASWALTQMAQSPNAGSAASGPEPLEPLTEREREVLLRMAHGDRNSEIAAALCVTEGTVKTHVHSILQKLGVQDRTQAVVWAFRNGLVPH
jgi:DNA-binding NarL/FixJ family response regulator